jgi:hypothetical protein
MIRNPVLFSAHFGIAPDKLAGLDVFDPTLNADTKLFIDPLLLRSSKHPAINADGVQAFDTYFGDIIRVLQHSQVVNDLSWRTVDRLFTFQEPKETCLGYGDRTTHGSSIGPQLRARIMETAKEIIRLGVRDPVLFALMGLLEQKIGPDRISDMTTHAIKPAILKFTEHTLATLSVVAEAFDYDGTQFQLVRNPFETVRSPIFLLPRDILRPLPVVNDWSDVAHAASKNAQLRQRVNKRIGDVWAIRTRKEKDDARAAVLRDSDALHALMEAVTASDKLPYDASMDAEGHYLWRRVLTELGTKFPLKIEKPKAETTNELERVVDEIILAFSDLVENKGQWSHLWHGTECRHERAVQRLFFAIADVYCKANNLDVSPETDSGGGPVDFKFSSGYDTRVVVEIKLSTGKVVHGYKTQLEVYKSAANTVRARYLIVDVGKLGKKLDQVLLLKNARANRGGAVTPVIVVDGRRKESASKRKSP